MPWSRHAKLAIICALIFPLAFYGCEVAPAAETPLANFSIALAKAVSFHNQSTSNLLTFHLLKQTCIEPGAEIAYRRCNLLRRTLDKHPWVQESVSNILLHYADQGLSGAARCASDVPPDVCPPVSYGSRAKWTEQAHEVKGPIGLLCTSLAEHRAAITSEIEVCG